MNHNKNLIPLLKQLLPGLLPIFVFILADEIWGTKIGLMVAIIFGFAELIYTYFKEKRLEKFVLLDTGLIVILGLISIVSHNDIFFKIKPGLIGIIICIFFGISAFSRVNLMAAMTKKYMKNVSLSSQQEKAIQNTTRNLFFIFVAYTLLVFISAFYMSNEAWAFISGGLFYILFGVYFTFELAKNRLLKNKAASDVEWLPLVDNNGRIIGKATRDACHNDKSLMHPVVHLHVINHKKQIFLQKRPESKPIQPGKWDTAVGGHVSAGESIEQALLREAKEEIGMKPKNVLHVSTYKWESEVETEYVFMFATRDNNNLKINPEEVTEGRFWGIKEIKENLGKGVFTPNFEEEFKLLEKNSFI